ncbi:ankyrin repeat-containing domain protein [Sphaerosporella brunnea]|uniref:Ankyrin repeat-containing domain protein n=1 Tax=Sphaerosporella brunnea TaxID=1250544 RepID=A0A5J5EH43_9PEZI|nr:ankyrin repeat-containing domain protein [Sphaerosporella brunnea]
MTNVSRTSGPSRGNRTRSFCRMWPIVLLAGLTSLRPLATLLLHSIPCTPPYRGQRFGFCYSPLIQRCTVIEILYITKNPAAGQAAKNLENSLLALYTALLNYLIAAKRLCTESSARRVLKSVFDPEALTPLLDAITTTENRVNSDSSLAEAELCHADYRLKVANGKILTNCLSFSSRHSSARAIMSYRSYLRLDLTAMRQTLTNALHDLSMPLHRIDVTLSGISAVLDDKETERAEILAWISPISYEKHHRQACERRTPNTGEWILARKEFMQWINSSSTTLLWLRGIPGAGKTMLTSRVIEDMMTRRDEEKNISALAYFYCDKKEQIRGKPEEILRALVKQLSHIPSQGGHVFQSVVTKYKHRKDAGNHKPGEDPLSLKECCELLAGLTNLYPLTVLVIDALDEAEEDSRYQLFQALKDLVVSSEKLVKIFVSSRDNHDIVLQLEKFSNFHIEARDNREDIEKFVRVESRALIDRKGWGPDVEEALCSALTAQANGMFMWASLHMKFLNTLRGKQAVFDRLKQLPPNLEATYEEILNRINKQETTDRTVAMRALQWVLVAREPLHPRQLCAAIHANIAHDSGQVNNEDKPTIELILGSCENLLVHDIELDVIRFAHLSVAEYLDSYLNFIEAHALAAIACLQYFFADSSTLKELSSYAAEYAFIHAKLCQEGSHREKPFPRLREMLQTFFHPVQSKQFDFWLSNISLPKDRMYRVFYWSDHIFPPITWVVFFGLKTTFKEVYPLDIVPGHLHLAACEGHLEIVNILLERGADVNLVGGDYGTALGIAAWYGHKEIVNILLERGADVNLVGGLYGTPLEIAAQCGYKEIVNTFLERGADVNLAGGHYGTPLGRAAWYGYQEIVNILLERGADVNIVGGGYGTALEAAASIGNREIVNVLLERGADVNLIGGDYGTALGAAAWIGNREIVNILLERDADVNLVGGDYGTALGAAAYNGHQEIVDVLLDRGADVNLVGGRYGTALGAAASRGNRGIVNVLLERGADVNLVGGDYGTALGAAAYNGHQEIVDVLLDRGADVNLVGGRYGTALGAAAFNEAPEIVTVLLERGADVNLVGGDYGTALGAAAWSTDQKIVNILLEHGADVNLVGGRYGTALGAAAWNTDQEIVNILLEHGADVNLVGGEYGTALGAAAWSTDQEIVNILLEHGADVNLVGGEYGTALAAAAWSGRQGIWNILLERGADVNLVGGRYGTALGAAASRGNREIVNILLERGADVNLVGGRYGTALGEAASRGKREIVNILLERGADVNLVGGEYGTALGEAASRGKREIVNILLERGADVNLVGGRYGTALGAAASRGNREIVNILLERGADINLVGGDYGTALGAAAFPVTHDLWGAEFTSHEKFESSREKLAVVRILIKRGADVNLPAGKYGTVLGIAAYSGEQELIKLLLDHGADANLVGDEFQAALQLVAQTSEESVSTDLDNASGTASIDQDASSSSTNTTLS